MQEFAFRIADVNDRRARCEARTKFLDDLFDECTFSFPKPFPPGDWCFRGTRQKLTHQAGLHKTVERSLNICGCNSASHSRPPNITIGVIHCRTDITAPDWRACNRNKMRLSFCMAGLAFLRVDAFGADSGQTSPSARDSSRMRAIHPAQWSSARRRGQKPRRPRSPLSTAYSRLTRLAAKLFRHAQAWMPALLRRGYGSERDPKGGCAGALGGRRPGSMLGDTAGRHSAERC